MIQGSKPSAIDKAVRWLGCARHIARRFELGVARCGHCGDVRMLFQPGAWIRARGATGGRCASCHTGDDVARLRREPAPKPAPPRHYVISVGRRRFVEGFTYPESITKRDRAWEKSEGVRVALCVKALIGPSPFVWSHQDSADHVAKAIPGAVVKPRPGPPPKNANDGRHARGLR